MTINNATTPRYSVKRLIRALSWTALLLVALGTYASAQIRSTTPLDGTTPSGLAPGAGSYLLSGFDSVNLYNGNLNFSLPLLQVGGRGGVQHQITLPIEQHWYVEALSSQCEAEGCGDPTRLIPRDYQDMHYMDNWTALQAGYGPAVVKMRSVGAPTSCTYPQTSYDYTLTRMTAIMPDGTEFELRDQLYDGRPIENPRCSRPFGASRGKVWKTTDGSAATFISATEISDITWTYKFESYASGDLVLRDGTRYHVVDGLTTWMRDRNGNTIKFFYGDVQTQNGLERKVTRIVDPLGREVSISYANYTTVMADTITYKGFGGASRTIRVVYSRLDPQILRPGYQIKTMGSLFPDLIPFCDICSWGEEYKPFRVSYVELPNGQRYQFFYNSYGELARAVLPTGGAYEYDWTPGSGVIIEGGDGGSISRRVIKRRTYPDGGSGSGFAKEEVYTAFSVGSWPNTAFTTVQVEHNKPGNQPEPVASEKHYFYGNPTPPANPDSFGYTWWRDGKEYKTEFFAPNSTMPLRRVEQTWQQRGPVNWLPLPNTSPCQPGPQDCAPTNDPRVVETVTTIEPNGANIVTKISSINPYDPTQIGFDQYNNQTDVWRFDYGQGVAGPLLSHTHNDYLTVNPINGVAYNSINPNTTTPDVNATIHLRSLPVRQSVYDANNVERARTTYEYDNYTPDTNNKHASLTNYFDISGLCTWYSPSFQCVNSNPADGSDPTSYKTRGNVTAVSSWLLSDTGAPIGDPVTSYMQYDIAGHKVTSIDPKGNATRFYFNDNFGIPDDNEARSNTPPTEGLTGGQSYAFLTKITNTLSFTSYAQYDYYTGKKVNVENINGAVTSAYYNDALDRPKQIVSAANSPTLRNRTKIEYDDTLRIIKIYSDQNNYSDQAFHEELYYDGLGRTLQTRVYDDATLPGQYILGTTEYDSMGRVARVSNPYRPTLGESAVYTMTEYDALSRIKKVTAPDSQPVVVDYAGNIVTVTDQAGKKRASSIDALGRLTQAVEDPGNYNYVTNYTYDVLGNLRKVAQGSQVRYFAYDSLSRLVRAKNPEQDTNTNLPSLTDPVTGWNQWSTAYTYDVNGNPETITDPRGVVATNSYDELNRIKTISYANGPTNTAPVTYTYDASGVANSKGRLTAVSSSVFTYECTSYDALGRIKGSSQVTDGQTYSMSYVYDLAGELTSETYPSGRAVTTNYDVAGRIVGLDGHQNNQTTPYLSAIKYWSFGAVKEMKLGNGLWEYAIFNNRLQPQLIGLGTFAPPLDGPQKLDRFRIDYDYGGTANNGNVIDQTISIPPYNSSSQAYQLKLMQHFTYDGLNRLKSATETSNNAPSWEQTFNYDQYGNRSIDPAHTTSDMVGDNPQISTSTNRLIPRQGELYHYDAAGNLDRDKADMPFTYDANNHIVAFNGGTLSLNGTSYYFDGLGQRVKKATAYNSTVFVYDAFGRIVAEYANTGQTGAGTNYITTDGLGTPRVITNASGGVRSRHDYLPFGEEIGGPYVSLKGNRTPEQMYVSDNLRQQFTGKERDAESGLDYFLARDYASRQGRFTSPDPFLGSASLNNPQTWNRYTYVLNNPLRFTDPLGLSAQEAKDEKKKEELRFFNLKVGQMEPQTVPVVLPDGQTGNLVSVEFNLTGVMNPEPPPHPDDGLIGGPENLGGNHGDVRAGVTGVVGTVLGAAITGIVAGGGGGAAAGPVIPADTVGIVGPFTATSYGTVYGTGWVDLRPTFERINAHPEGDKINIHSRDGSTYNNSPQYLPVQPNGYYTEYVVPTPGASLPGRMRLVVGNGGEVWFTDHYKGGTFVPLNDQARSCGCGPAAGPTGP